MPNKDLAITFESNVPVVGQILILEAIDFLYSLEALAQVGWREDAEAIENWQRLLATSPGKLLSPEYVLTLKSAYTGSVTEVVSGLAESVERLVEFLLLYKSKKQQAQLRELSEKLRIVREELLPLIIRLEERGTQKERIDRIIDRAVLYVDEVLTELMAQEKLQIKAA